MKNKYQFTNIDHFTKIDIIETFNNMDVFNPTMLPDLMSL